MNEAVIFIGGVLSGVMVTGAAWWGSLIAKYGPADEQDIDNYQTKEASK